MRFVFVLLMAVLAGAPASGQTVQAPFAQRAVRLPEADVPQAQKLTFLTGYLASDAPLQDRWSAMLRGRGLAAGATDAAQVGAWRESEARFFRAEAAKIDAAMLPAPPAACDGRPDAQSTMPVCTGRLVVNYETGRKYDLLAELAHLDGAIDRELALREAAAIFNGGPAPHQTYWNNLASRAAILGRYDTAMRICAYLRAAQYRSAGADPFAAARACETDAALRTGRWSAWLALQRNKLDATPEPNAEALLAYCVAFTHARERESAARACARADAAMESFSNALRTWANHPEAQTLAMSVSNATFGAPNHHLPDMIVGRAQAQHVAFVEVVRQLWESERPVVSDVIAACGRAADGPPEGCAMPAGVRALAVSFRTRAEAVQAFREIIEGQRAPQKKTAP